MAAEVEAGQGERPAGKKRARIMVDVSPELRRRIKVAAAQSSLSVRAYVERILEQSVPAVTSDEETRQQAQRQPVSAEWVAQLRAFQEDWARRHPGVVLDDSVEEIRRMREERTRHLESL